MLIEKKIRKFMQFFMYFVDVAPHILIDCLIVCEREDNDPHNRILANS
jgi:hypothetical protein